jgi:hypothetical protein
MSKESIEFSRRRRKQDAQTRRKISLGLDRFWDKEGRQSEKDKAKTRRNVQLGLATLGVAGAIGGGALYLNKKGKKGPPTKKVPKPINKVTLSDGSVVDVPKAPPKQIGSPGVKEPYRPAKGKNGKPVYRPDLDSNIGSAAQEDSKRRAANAAKENEKRVVDPAALADTRQGGRNKQRKNRKKGAGKYGKPINNQDMTVTPERGESVQKKEEFSPERKERFKKGRNANRRGILQSERVREARRSLRQGQKDNASPEEIEKLQGRVDAQKRLRRERYRSAKYEGAWFKKARIESVIEFSRKRKQDAKTRQRISRSLENFWNKKGRKNKSNKRILNKTAKVALAGAGIVGTGVAAHQLIKNKNNGSSSNPYNPQNVSKAARAAASPTPIATVGTKEQEKVVAETQKQVTKTVNPAPKPRKKSPGRQLSLFDTKPYKIIEGERGPKSGNIIDKPPKQITPLAPKPRSDGSRQRNLFPRGYQNYQSYLDLIEFSRKQRKDKGRKRRPYRVAKAALGGAAVGTLLGVGLYKYGKSKKQKQMSSFKPPASEPSAASLKGPILLRQRRKQYVEDSGISLGDLTKTTKRAREGSKSAQNTLRSIAKRTKKTKDLTN